MVCCVFSELPYEYNMLGIKHTGGINENKMGVVMTVRAINPTLRIRIGEEYTRKVVVGIANK